MSKSRNTSRRMPKRPVRLPLTGDPSPLPAPKYIDKDIIRAMLAHGDNIEMMLQTMSDTEILSLGIKIGVKASDMLGIDHCYEHQDMLLMGGRPVSGINYATDVRWCVNCYQYFRYKKA